jgi:hypothetical protein
MFDQLDTPPRWARSWCYFYLVAAVIAGLSAVIIFVSLLVSYEAVSKTKGGASLAAATAFAGVFQAVTAMVMFWMCRSALK